MICRYCGKTVKGVFIWNCKLCGNFINECRSCNHRSSYDTEKCPECGVRPPLTLGRGLTFVLLAPVYLLFSPFILIAWIIAYVARFEWVRKTTEPIFHCLGATLAVLLIGAFVIAILVAFLAFIIFIFQNPGGRPPWAM